MGRMSKEKMTSIISILFVEVLGEVKKLNIPIHDNIKKDVKITRNHGEWASCKYDRENDQFELQLSESLFKSKQYVKVIKETLGHELLHTCPNCLNHSNEWKKYAEMMNEEYDYSIKRVDSEFDILRKGLPTSPPKSYYKYVLQCTKCKTKFYRNRKSSIVTNTEDYSCSCGGKLKRLK